MKKGLIQIRWVAACVLLCAFTGAGEIIDKVVAVVGNRAITESEVNLQIALQSFIDRETLERSTEKRRQALNRLIERRLVRQEMAAVNFLEASDPEVRRKLDSLKTERFASGLGFQAALKKYGLAEKDLQEFLRSVITFTRYLDFRFRTGLVITPKEIEDYYRGTYLRKATRMGVSSPPPLEKVYDEMEAILTKEREARADQLEDDWIRSLRARSRVEILDESLQAAGQ